MNRKGIVSSITENKIYVMALSQRDEEKSCVSQGCGSGCSCSVTGKIFTAENPQEFPLKEGDRVEVEASSSDLWRGILLVFVLPLFGTIGGWAFSAYIETNSVWWILGGLALGLILSWLFSRKEKYPKVKRLL